jgi:3-hydroxybutyryl-CoA dehydrogenase
MAIEKIGVVGCGLMGAGIAQTAAQAGFQVTVREVSTELIDKGFANIDKSLARLVQRGTLTAAQRDAARNRLRGTSKLDDLAGCDFIIEAITEQLAVKEELFRALGAV